MRIIVDNGAHSLRNMGDVAMLQVAVSRIRAVHRGAEIAVLTHRPDLLHRYCPGTVPISASARDAFYAALNDDHGAGGETSSGGAWSRLRGRPTPPERCPEEFAKTLADASMLVIAGGGFLNDLNARVTETVFRMCNDALNRGLRVTMLSQGLGPLEKPYLVDLLAAIAQRGAFIGLREPCSRPVVLLKAAALPNRWAVTGDDALELVGASTMPNSSDDCIGFSVRQVCYSGIEPEHIDALTEGLRALRRNTAASLVPIPISFNSFEDDFGTISRILGTAESQMVDSPHAVAMEVQRCRIVIAGTYHAAVFAAGQGVPCICFHASRYYREKMEGLAAQFGPGCASVDIADVRAVPEVFERAQEFWMRANQFRSELTARTARQVAESRAFSRRALALHQRELTICADGREPWFAPRFACEHDQRIPLRP